MRLTTYLSGMYLESNALYFSGGFIHKNPQTTLTCEQEVGRHSTSSVVLSPSDISLKGRKTRLI